MVCQSMGRHAHVDFCRSADPAACSAVGLQHSQTRLVPEPNRPKDWISHKLYWQRSGKQSLLSELSKILTQIMQDLRVS
jgi:hypothetical protein